MKYDIVKHSFMDDMFNDIDFPFQDKDSRGITFSVDLDKSNYKILHKSGITENSSFQMFRGRLGNEPEDVRIGWLIPVYALFSTSHNYADNVHFAYYAFLCYHKFLNNKDILTELATTNNLYDAIANVYGTIDEKGNIITDMVVLISENLDVQNMESIALYLPSLYQYGYYLESRSANDNAFLQDSKSRIKVNSISSFFKNDSIINVKFVYKFLIEYCFEPDPRMRFMALYQIIEIVIDDILRDLLLEQADAISTGSLSLRSSDLNSGNMTEFARFNKIFDIAQIKKASYKRLDEECLDLMKAKGMKVDKLKEFPDSLYHFRNSVVHRLRWFVDKEDDISSINDMFEILVYDILINYKRKYK